MRRLTAILTLALLLVGPAAMAAILNVPADHATLADAVSAASAGDQITIDDGTYTLSSTVYVTKSLTITGESEAGVVLQVDAGTGYGLSLAADDITLEYFTLDVITAGAEAGYPIHASGTNTLPGGTGYYNLLIQHLTVKGDATSTPKRRAGIDIHGFTDVTLLDVESRDASYGNGIQFTGCINVNASDITTSNNQWGSIAIYCSQPAYMNRGCDNVVLDGFTMNLAENGIFQQDEFGLFSTNVSGRRSSASATATTWSPPE